MVGAGKIEVLANGQHVESFNSSGRPGATEITLPCQYTLVLDNEQKITNFGKDCNDKRFAITQVETFLMYTTILEQGKDGKPYKVYKEKKDIDYPQTPEEVISVVTGPWSWESFRNSISRFSVLRAVFSIVVTCLMIISIGRLVRAVEDIHQFAGILRAENERRIGRALNMDMRAYLAGVMLQAGNQEDEYCG